MAEPTIKAKLVLDTAGMQGAAAGLGAGGGGQTQGIVQGIRQALEGLDTQVIGDIGAALAGAVLFLEKIWDTLKAGFSFLAKSSPILSSSINILHKGLQVLLRPIGDAIGLFIKPFAIAMLRFAIPIYKKWRDFLGSDKAQEGLGRINEGAGQVAEGIITLDFDKVKEGLGNIGGGLLDVGQGFFSFLGEELPNFWEKFKTFAKDAWTEFAGLFKDEDGTLGGPLGDALKGAWNGFWDFIGSLGGEEWQKNIDGLKGGLEGIWGLFGDFIKDLGAVWWLGPLAPLAVALMLLWDAALEPMMKSLKDKLTETFPSIMGLFNISDTIAEGGKSGWESFKDFFASEPIEFDPTGGQGTMTTEQLMEKGVIPAFEDLNGELVGMEKNWGTMSGEIVKGIGDINTTSGSVFGEKGTIPLALDVTKGRLDNNKLASTLLNEEMAKFNATYNTYHNIWRTTYVSTVED